MRCSGACATALLSTSAARSVVIGDFRERRVRDDADQRAFELADVRRNDFGDERRHFVGNRNILALGLLAQNSFARFEIGRLDIGEQPPLESRAQPRFERLNLFGRTVGRDNELAARFVQCVERVEELFLRRFFAGEKLDVVDQQNVDLAIAIAKLRRPVVLQRDDELVGELLAGEVDDVGVGIIIITRWPIACIKCVFPKPTPP